MSLVVEGGLVKIDNRANERIVPSLVLPLNKSNGEVAFKKHHNYSPPFGPT